MTTDLTTRIDAILARLRRLKELRAKATQGKWECEDYVGWGINVNGVRVASSNVAQGLDYRANAAFIAEAVNLSTPMVDGMILLIEALLAVVAHDKAAIEGLKEIGYDYEPSAEVTAPTIALQRFADLFPEDLQYWQRLSTDSEAKLAATERERNWPHCEVCNFPLQDQGMLNGMVCLLCNVREQRDAAIAKNTALLEVMKERDRIDWMKTGDRTEEEVSALRKNWNAALYSPHPGADLLAELNDFRGKEALRVVANRELLARMERMRGVLENIASDEPIMCECSHPREAREALE